MPMNPSSDQPPDAEAHVGDPARAGDPTSPLRPGENVDASLPRKRRIPWWARVLVYGVPVLLLAAIAVPNFMKSRTTACKSSCVANLRQIDGAKQQWALEHKKKASDVPVVSDITEFLKNSQLPVCPESGTYTLHAVSADPTCTQVVNGHSL